MVHNWGKLHTNSVAVMYRGGEIWKLICVFWNLSWGTNDSLAGRLAWGGVGLEKTMQIGYKMSFVKDSFERFRQHFMYNSRWLFLELYILNHTTKMHIFEYVCKTCLEELAINTEKHWKNIAASNISKNSALLIFLPYFKDKYFLRAPHNGHLILI